MTQTLFSQLLASSIFYKLQKTLNYLDAQDLVNIFFGIFHH